MKVVGNKRPGKTLGIAGGYEAAKSFKEILAIIVIKKYFAPFNSPGDNMVQRSGGIYSRLAWHANTLSKGSMPANLFT
jgi:hypothetical protein